MPMHTVSVITACIHLRDTIVWHWHSSAAMPVTVLLD